MKRIIRAIILSLGLSFSLSVQLFAQTYYWVGGSGNWSDVNHWATSSGNVNNVKYTQPPTSLNHVVFDNNSIDPTLNEYTVTVDSKAVCANMDWITTNDTIIPTFTGAENLSIEIYGHLNIGTSIINNFEGTYIFKGNTDRTIAASTSFHSKSTIKFSDQAIFTLGSPITVNNLIIENGELDVSANNYSINVNGNWTILDNPTAKFNCRAGVVVFRGNSQTAYQEITANSRNYTDREFFNVEINNKGIGILLQSQVSIGKNNAGRITFLDGIVNTTSANNLIINNSAEVSGADDGSHVNGYVTKIGGDGDNEFIFPIGNGTSYRPAGLKFPNSNPNTTLTAKYTSRSATDTNYPPQNATTPLSVSRYEYWEVNRIGGGASPNVILSWKIPVSGPVGYLGDASNVSELVAVSWDANDNKWINRGAKADQYIIENASPASYEGYLQSIIPLANDRIIWTIGSEIIPLPIDLLYFQANLVKNQVLFNWATAKEVNNDYFTIEKSADGTSFTTLLQIKGAGNSQEIRKYTAADANPYSGVTYYRLKQTDVDGKFEYSKTIAVYTNGTTTNSLLVNSTDTKQIRISYLLATSQKGLLTVHNSKGVQVSNKSVSGNQAGTLQTVLLPVTSSGWYIVSLQQDSQVITKKLIVP